MQEQEAIRKAVRERYSEVARRTLARSEPESLPIVSGHCGCCSDGGQDFGAALYGPDEVGRLPAEARAASLGCGNPTAIAGLRPGEVVLDLGCGGGIDVLLAAERVGPGGRVIGLDVNPDMLRLARHNAARAGVTNVEFLEGDIEAIPLPDGSVDTIVSNCVINLTPDKRQALREAFRVLRPGGRLAVSDMVFLGDASAIPLALRQNLAAWAGCVAGALTVDEYRTFLEAAGFADIQIDVTRSWGPESPEAEALARHLPLEDAEAARRRTRAGGIRLAAADIRARRPLASDRVPGSSQTGASSEGSSLPASRAARPEDFPELMAFLQSAGLPSAGVADHLANFRIVNAGPQIVGSAGLELYGAEALLRSVAVHPCWRGYGLGTGLAREVLETAGAAGARRVWLLTTTAERFFARLGFRTVGRDELPSALSASQELQGACPETAVAMVLELAPRPK